VQFVFENLVFTFQFNEMRLNCHSKPPRLDETSDRSGQPSLHEPPKLSMGIAKRILIFPRPSVTNREYGTLACLHTPLAETIFRKAAFATFRNLIAFFS
jgi:hypothetical protein